MSHLAFKTDALTPNVRKTSSVKILANMITAPAEAINDLLGAPKLWVPLILNGVSVPLLYFLRYPLYHEMIRKTIERSLMIQNQQLAPEQLELSLKIASTYGIVAAPIVSVLSWFLMTVAFYFAAKAFKGEGRFRQYLSITGYACVIRTVYVVLCYGVSFFSGELLLNASLGLAVPWMQGSIVYGLLRSIDIFTVWYFTVVGMGIAMVSKLDKRKAYLITTAVFMVTVLLGAFSNRAI